MDEKTLAYHREYNLRRYHRIFAELIAENGGKCVVCGSVSDLNFDHIDPKSMSFRVSTGITTRKISEVRQEVAKCQLLCSDCHKAKTREDMGQLPAGTHGTLTMYSHNKCRCDECKEAWNSHSREYRRKRKVLAAGFDG